MQIAGLTLEGLNHCAWQGPQTRQVIQMASLGQISLYPLTQGHGSYPQVSGVAKGREGVRFQSEDFLGRFRK